MLDLLLNASKDKRNAIIKRLKTSTKRRIFDNIYTMTEELGLDEIPDFETRVNMRYELIQRFPDRVFWDFAEVANPKSDKRKTDVPEYERFPVCKISTRGDVVILNEINRLYVYRVEPKNRYSSVHLGYNTKTQHRLIASTFIPKPNRLNHIPYQHLQVNHIDLTRWNNQIENLEWVMGTENSRHRYHVDRYSEEKYFLFKVVIDNGYKDREFVLSEHDLHCIGTDFTQLRKLISNGSTYRGTTVQLLHHEDIKNIPVGYPDDIAELFNLDSQYFNTLVKPVIGTVLWGKYMGFEFSLFGGAEIAKHFNRGHVEAVANGTLRSHHGCTFRRCTHKEAIPLHGKLTKKIADDARSYKKRNYPKDP